MSSTNSDSQNGTMEFRIQISCKDKDDLQKKTKLLIDNGLWEFTVSSHTIEQDKTIISDLIPTLSSPSASTSRVAADSSVSRLSNLSNNRPIKDILPSSCDLSQRAGATAVVIPQSTTVKKLSRVRSSPEDDIPRKRLLVGGSHSTFKKLGEEREDNDSSSNDLHTWLRSGSPKDSPEEEESPSSSHRSSDMAPLLDVSQSPTNEDKNVSGILDEDDSNWQDVQLRALDLFQQSQRSAVELDISKSSTLRRRRTWNGLGGQSYSSSTDTGGDYADGSAESLLRFATMHTSYKRVKNMDVSAVCTICEKVIKIGKGWDAKSSHAITHSELERFACPVPGCGYKNKQRPGIWYHMGKVHPEEEKSTASRECMSEEDRRELIELVETCFPLSSYSST